MSISLPSDGENAGNDIFNDVVPDVVDEQVYDGDQIVDQEEVDVIRTKS